MSIQKKTLIKSLKATKKANVAASTPATKEGVATRKTHLVKSKLFSSDRM